MNSIIIRNCNCLDPQHAVVYETRDLIIENGIFKASDEEESSIDQEIDAANKIVVAGGIFPSFGVPVLTTGLMKSWPSAAARVLTRCGFTTVIADGVSPFVALDVHRYLQHLPGVNKVTFIDVGNYQFMAGFLKNGVANYAAALEKILLDQFKGYSISCMNPGSTVHWRNEIVTSNNLFEPLPFLGISGEKIISELVAAHALGIKTPALIVETGIEGLPGSTEDFIPFLATVWSRVPEDCRDNTNPAIAFKQISRASCDPDQASGEIGGTVQRLQSSIQEHPGLAGFLDIPPITSDDVKLIDGSNSWLLKTEDIIARGMIEGEMFQSLYHVANDQKKEILGKYWLAGMRYLLDLPAELHDTIAFSVMPGIITDPRDIVDIMGSLLSVAHRNFTMSKITGNILTDSALELLGDKVISFPAFVHFSRVVPARMLRLERYIGGLEYGQVGDAIIMDAEVGDLDAIMNDPSWLQDMLSNPFAVIKGGNLIFKNHEFNYQDKGYTFLQEMQGQSSIMGSIKENLDKQFLKYYSTHENSKVVLESMIEPVLKT
ncbi:MAG TPA: hypothetical protein VKM55_18635 [Candidatus Lokiarchaeia archaeon]|nr:hypothetical protein [Candidatus Lokiarchaeia archaeon]